MCGYHYRPFENKFNTGTSYFIKVAAGKKGTAKKSIYISYLEFIYDYQQKVPLENELTGKIKCAMFLF